MKKLSKILLLITFVSLGVCCFISYNSLRVSQQLRATLRGVNFVSSYQDVKGDGDPQSLNKNSQEKELQKLRGEIEKLSNKIGSFAAGSTSTDTDNYKSRLIESLSEANEENGYKGIKIITFKLLSRLSHDKEAIDTLADKLKEYDSNFPLLGEKHEFFTSVRDHIEQLKFNTIDPRVSSNIKSIDEISKKSINELHEKSGSEIVEILKEKLNLDGYDELQVKLQKIEVSDAWIIYNSDPGNNIETGNDLKINESIEKIFESRSLAINKNRKLLPTIEKLSETVPEPSMHKYGRFESQKIQAAKWLKVLNHPMTMELAKVAGPKAEDARTKCMSANVDFVNKIEFLQKKSYNLWSLGVFKFVHGLPTSGWESSLGSIEPNYLEPLVGGLFSELSSTCLERIKDPEMKLNSLRVYMSAPKVKLSNF